MGWGEGCIEDIFANAAFCIANTFTGGGIFLRKGNKQGTEGSTAARGFFVRGDVIRQSTSGGSTQPSPPNLEDGTYVRQQQQIGETYTKHGATVANW